MDILRGRNIRVHMGHSTRKRAHGKHLTTPRSFTPLNIQHLSTTYRESPSTNHFYKFDLDTIILMN